MKKQTPKYPYQRGGPKKDVARGTCSHCGAKRVLTIIGEICRHCHDKV
jgi:hypothetical protein